MHCTVLLFAHLAESLGTKTLDIELADDARVDELLDELGSRHTVIATMRATLAVAVDEAYANGTTPLTEGCTVALIPPVSGG